MRWSPTQYDLFADHRSTPFFDLTARIRDSDTGAGPRRVVDLGCGPGSLTRTLAERWPDAEVVGLDSSPDMIDAARAQTGLPSNLRFEPGDIAEWTPGPEDVVVSNAALQWVPTHRDLLPGWLAALPVGGWFALQVPGSATNESHRILRKLAGEERWAPALASVIRPEETVAPASGYLETMLEADFEAVYAARLREAYPPGRFGTVYPFRRIFAVGHKPASTEAA